MGELTPPLFERTAKVIRVIDGDTLEISADLGCDTQLRMTCRLIGIDAPERGTTAGTDATSFVMQWLGQRNLLPLRLRTQKDKREKYGRYLIDLLDPAGLSLVDALLESGHAVAKQY